jgi:hypothetical protein
VAQAESELADCQHLHGIVSGAEAKSSLQHLRLRVRRVIKLAARHMQVAANGFQVVLHLLEQRTRGVAAFRVGGAQSGQSTARLDTQIAWTKHVLNLAGHEQRLREP